MFEIDQEQCKKCKMCVKECPVGAVDIKKSAAETIIEITDRCVECGICRRVCKFEAIPKTSPMADAVVCSSCPIQCKVPLGATGACRRYRNVDGKLIRNRALVIEAKRQESADELIRKPVITAVGAGTNYPCSKPAPHIVSQCRDGVDVVTVVTEAPLSYSGLIVKLDTNTYIGEEGDPVYRDNKIVGMVNTEEYGSKMIAIGGANKLTSDSGFATARTIVELANGEAVELKVNRKISLKLKTGQAPIIDGVEESIMRIGCGSATVGLFAKQMKEAVDECIVIDHHVIGLCSEHLAGEAVGMTWSGVIPNAVKSSRGRYFGEHGHGIGGTTLETPRDAIKGCDMTIAKPGIQIMVVNTTGEIYALFILEEDGSIVEVPMTEAALKVAMAIQNNCQRSMTSVLYTGGTGGSARGGVCTHPVKITEAVHAQKAVLTIGGAPAFVYPGGGINFMVDTEKVVNKAFTWVPTPATVAPVEYTMKKSDYQAMGGHMDQIRDVSEYIDND
ncbi:MAG: 4Fe-4S binding protein [Acetobacterium sp.]|nr:4Fe-4S binding protein [Acetobacterium sp.]